MEFQHRLHKNGMESPQRIFLQFAHSTGSKACEHVLMRADAVGRVKCFNITRFLYLGLPVLNGCLGVIVGQFLPMIYEAQFFRPLNAS